MSRQRKKTHVQLSLEAARKPPKTHGGWRPKAGRKKKKGAVSHSARRELPSRFPAHVTLRLADGIESIARDFLMKINRQAIRDSHKPWFRIVEFNVLSNHLHLICEAQDKEFLARGVQGFAVRTARRLNRALERRGKLFAHRYHARHLKTPKEVRNVLRYVLLNRKHHNAEQRFAKYWFDPFSSAAWFGGWDGPIRVDTEWKRALVKAERPNAKPSVWLLTTGWRRHGLLRFDEAPA